jgi:hypothetical protein
MSVDDGSLVDTSLLQGTKAGSILTDSLMCVTPLPHACTAPGWRGTVCVVLMPQSMPSCVPPALRSMNGVTRDPPSDLLARFPAIPGAEGGGARGKARRGEWGESAARKHAGSLQVTQKGLELLKLAPS